MSEFLKSISQFVENINNQVSITFKNISDFLDSVLTFFVTAEFWVVTIIFFAVFVAIIYSPIWIFKYWNKLNESYGVLIKAFIKKL